MPLDGFRGNLEILVAKSFSQGKARTKSVDVVKVGQKKKVFPCGCAVRLKRFSWTMTSLRIAEPRFSPLTPLFEFLIFLISLIDR
jgi:hypothetical protein